MRLRPVLVPASYPAAQSTNTKYDMKVTTRKDPVSVASFAMFQTLDPLLRTYTKTTRSGASIPFSQPVTEPLRIHVSVVHVGL